MSVVFDACLTLSTCIYVMWLGVVVLRVVFVSLPVEIRSNILVCGVQRSEGQLRWTRFASSKHTLSTADNSLARM